MLDLDDLGIKSVIQTGTLVFSVGDDDYDFQYDKFEEDLVHAFDEQAFGCVSLEVDDAEFLRYKIIARAEDKGDFYRACEWFMEYMNRPYLELEVVV